MYVLLDADEYLLLFQEIQIGPDHQAEVPEMMGPNYQDGESGRFYLKQHIDPWNASTPLLMASFQTSF